MTKYGPYIHFRPCDGKPWRLGELFTLRKGSRLAVCALWSHPLGGEVRLDVDGEMLRTAAGRDGLALVELGLEWKRQFEEKGWNDMKLGDVAKSPCESCNGGPVRLVRKRVPDTSAGQGISQEFDILDVWTCERCGHEQGGSFQPDPRLLHEG